jgi:hypothetical protein
MLFPSSVLLPESFRGGCSFGAVAFAAGSPNDGYLNSMVIVVTMIIGRPLSPPTLETQEMMLGLMLLLVAYPWLFSPF